LAFAAALLAVSGSAAARSPAIVQHIAPGAFAYVPATITGPAPLIVVLHGAGGDARYFLDQFKHDADRRGAILLSVQSSGRTWAQRKPKDDEADVANIRTAIAELTEKAPIDKGRTTVMVRESTILTASVVPGRPGCSVPSATTVSVRAPSKLKAYLFGPTLCTRI